MLLFSLWDYKNTRIGRQPLLVRECWDSRCVINLGNLLLPDVEAEVPQACHCACRADEAGPIIAVLALKPWPAQLCLQGGGSAQRLRCRGWCGRSTQGEAGRTLRSLRTERVLSL